MHILDEELYQAGMALADIPTAAGHEQLVRARLLAGLADLPGVSVRVDFSGNVIARYAPAGEWRQPFRVVAHLDHPALVVDRFGSRPLLHLAGGVEERFLRDQSIVFHDGENLAPLGTARITATDFENETKLVSVDEPIPAMARFATWKLPPARCSSRSCIAPACDDLVQAATQLALMRRLSASGEPACVEALWTRAEEIGFGGALAALSADPPLEVMPTLSLETSQARGFARVGGGPVLRVGDKLTVFDSGITFWLETAMRDYQRHRPSFLYQRLLMGGGTCEASVFQQAGLPTGALCLALNNYHNMGSGRLLRSESVSLQDWQHLFDFLFFLATGSSSITETTAALSLRFNRLREKTDTFLRTREEVINSSQTPSQIPADD